MTTSAINWSSLIDDVLLSLTYWAEGADGLVETVYLTGSYARGNWNDRRPNINVYFIARAGATARARAELAKVFARVRRCTRERGAEFLVDCHPFTISQSDPRWQSRPTLTLTTKVFDAVHANDRQRLLVSPTIGYGWWVTHRVLHGAPDALAFLSNPPPRDDEWFAGAHGALCSYRRMLDHLPWAFDVELDTARFVEETCRYAEEALKDGVHFGSTDEEILSAANMAVLHNWTERAHDYFADRYGPDGMWAVEAVALMKETVLTGGLGVAEALAMWENALRVWTVVWKGYLRLVEGRSVNPALRQVTSWM